MTVRWPIWTLAIIPLFAQGPEADLKRFFEGKEVLVKLDMPGDDSGVDVDPSLETSVNYKSVGDSLRRYGIAIRKGQPVMVTLIKIKPKLIEFQMAGGGYGSWGDTWSVPSAPSGSSPGAAQARVAREQLIREKRLESGSRFNVRYPAGVPADAATPEAVLAVLRPYLDFPFAQGSVPAAVQDPTGLRKGMSEAQVNALLGEPASRQARPLEDMEAVEARYRTVSALVSVRFVNGVLVKYVIEAR